MSRVITATMSFTASAVRYPTRRLCKRSRSESRRTNEVMNSDASSMTPSVSASDRMFPGRTSGFCSFNPTEAAKATKLEIMQAAIRSVEVGIATRWRNSLHDVSSLRSHLLARKSRALILLRPTAHFVGAEHRFNPQQPNQESPVLLRCTASLVKMRQSSASFAWPHVRTI